MRRWMSSAILVSAVSLAMGAAHADWPQGPPPPPPSDVVEPGYLVVYSTPFARLHIDGKDTGKVTPITSRARISLAPGVHRLTFIVGDEIFHFRVRIKSGETHKIVKQLPVTG